jgi:hypothetical protein
MVVKFLLDHEKSPLSTVVKFPTLNRHYITSSYYPLYKRYSYNHHDNYNHYLITNHDSLFLNS